MVFVAPRINEEPELGEFGQERTWKAMEAPVEVRRGDGDQAKKNDGK